MKITHLVCTPNFAGVERHIAVLAAAQHDRGHDVTVLGGDTDRMRAEIARQQVRVLPAPDVVTALRLLAGPAGRLADVVATHMTAADLAASASPTLMRTPIVSTRHFAAARGSTPSARLVSGRLQRRIRAEVSVSEFIAGAVELDTTVILPGIRNRPDGQRPSSRGQTVLVAQRLEPEKATYVAVAAFAASGLADVGWRLMIAGEGSLRRELERQACQLGISGATDFLGYRGDVEQLMSRASIFFASAGSEPMGLSVLEAMASGVPVIAAAGGGHLESVGGAPDAVLFPPGDAGVAGRMLADLARDPERLDRYGRALRERQQQAFSIAAQAEATEALLDHVVACKRPLPLTRTSTGRDLVVISLEPWDQIWRRNQHLLGGLLRADPTLRVLFVEPARDPLHAARIRQVPRPGRGLRRGPHLPGVNPDALWLLEPTKVLPRRLDQNQDRRWADDVRGAVGRLGFARPTLWVNDPGGAILMERAGWPTLYDITDDWLEAARDPATLARLARNEAALMHDAVEVLVCSDTLARTKSEKRPVTLLHNAVDVDATARSTARPFDLPDGPVAVYVGTLHPDRLDISLCENTAQALASSGTLVLVGPDALAHEEGARLDAADVVRLGPKDRRLVAGYLQHADVLVVPHVVDDFTDSLDPIKLYEYRAVGRPVVSTPVAGFREASNSRLRVVERELFARAVVDAIPAPDRYPHGVDLQVPTWADRVEEMQSVLDRVDPTRAVSVSTTDRPRADVPLDVRVRFGHAAVQRIADEHGIDLLHIKGNALEDSLVHVGRTSTDADILVRPAHVHGLLAACAAHGYRRVGKISTSSPFEHSTTLWHDLWGHLDVHHHYPGIGLTPEDAFEGLWAGHGLKKIAGINCPTPDLVAQVGILILHAGRSPAGGQTGADVNHVWREGSPALRRQARAWAQDMNATVPFAAGIGELESLPPSAEKGLWTAVRGEGRVQEWRARIAAAPGLRSRVRLLLRAPLVNTDHLSTQLGHTPSRQDVVRAFADRALRAVREIAKGSER